MSQWGAFVGCALLLTVVLLILARQSQQFVAEYTEDGSEDATESTDATATDTELTDATATDTKSTDIDSTDMESADTESTTTVERQSRDSGGGRERGGAISPNVELTSRMLLVNVAATQGLVAVAVITAGYLFSIPASAFGIEQGPLTFGLPGVGVGIVLGLGLWIANELSTAVADAVGATYDEKVRKLLAPESIGGWIVLLVGVLPIIAVGEELLFRAALIGVPAAGFGISPWLLAIGSSFAFALGHGAQGRVGIAVTGVLGFALAGGYVLTGSLLVVVVAHYLINALEFLVHEFDAFAFEGDHRP